MSKQIVRENGENSVDFFNTRGKIASKFRYYAQTPRWKFSINFRPTENIELFSPGLPVSQHFMKKRSEDMALLYQQQGSLAMARINTFQPNFLLLKTINFCSELLCSWWSHYRGIRHSHVYWQQHPLSPVRAD